MTGPFHFPMSLEVESSTLSTQRSGKVIKKVDVIGYAPHRAVLLHKKHMPVGNAASRTSDPYLKNSVIGFALPAAPIFPSIPMKFVMVFSRFSCW